MKWLRHFAPNDTQVERGFVASTLLRPSLMAEVRRKIEPADFFEEGYGRVFRAMVELWDQGEAITVAAVEGTLVESGMAANEAGLLVSGITCYVRHNEINSDSAHRAEASYLRGFALARKLEAVAHSMLDDLYDRTGSAAECVLSQTIEKLMDIQVWEEDAEEKHERFAALRSMPYVEYLASMEWQDKRRAILQRDGNACRICNATDGLNVHHRTYERRGDEAPGDLITLCQPCHQLFHENGKLAKPEG